MEVNSTAELINCSICPIIDEFFELIANTGRPHLPWELIRNPFIWKLQVLKIIFQRKRECFKIVMDRMHITEAEQQKDDCMKEELINDKEIANLKEFIMDKAKEFDGTPFTIQRFKLIRKLNLKNTAGFVNF